MMPELDGRQVLDALTKTYAAVSAAVTNLPDEAFARPTRCAGWSVRDVLFHLLLDPQRALIAFASPAAGDPTADFITYWRGYEPGTSDALRHAEFVRRASSAYLQPSTLAEMWTLTAPAALRAAAATPMSGRIETQNLVLDMPDFLATLTVEAALHHLYLTVQLDSPPPVPPSALETVRMTLDGLLGVLVPAGWDAETYALKGTGRARLNDDDRRDLGRLVDRLPLLG